MKKTARFFSVVLCLILMFSLATTVSASMVSWGEGTDAKTMILTVSEADSGKDYEVAGIYEEILHTKGRSTVLPYTNYNVTVDAHFSNECYLYYDYVLRAMAMEGMKATWSASGNAGSITIPATFSSGSYAPYIEYNYKSADWTISNGNIAYSNRAVDAPTYGYINNAPTGVYTIVARQTNLW